MRSKWIPVALALALTAGSAAAQGPGGMGGGQGMQAQMREMQWKGITLTDKQKATLDSLDGAQRALMQEMMGADRSDPSVREKMQAARTKRMEAIKAMLTAEQLAQYEKNTAEMRQMMGGGRPGGPPPRD